MDTRERFLHAILIRILILLLLLMLVPLVLGAQAVSQGRVRTIQLANPVQIGDVRLPAGEFVVRYTSQGDSHTMVFQRKGKTAQEFRAACTLHQLANKAENDEQLYRHGPAGEWILVGLTFKGDMVEHRF